MLYAENFKTQMKELGTSSEVQWLRLHTSTARGVGSIPGWGTKIPGALWQKRRKNLKKEIKELKKWRDIMCLWIGRFNSTNISSSQISKKYKKEFFQIQFYKACTTLIPKMNVARKENYRPIFLRNTDVKILNKILANQIQNTLKGSYTTIKWDLCHECKDSSNQSMW